MLKYDKTVDVKEEQLSSGLSFRLFHNYPNPFNPKTTISYAIPEKSKITLKIYDILGREIVLLENKEQSAGEYEIEFDASKYNLSSGVYLYELKSQNFRAAKKMLLAK